MKGEKSFCHQTLISIQNVNDVKKKKQKKKKILLMQKMEIEISKLRVQ